MPRRKTTEKVIAEKKAYQIDVLNTEGKSVEKISLPEKIFAAKVNKKLIAQAIRVYLANQRQGTQSSQTRGEVTSSTAKIWRQKGTGRARHGARSAPIFVGGGVAHGPHPRDFSLKMSKRMRRSALFATLADKLKENGILVVKGLEEIKPKTKEMAKILNNLKTVGVDKEAKKKITKILVILPGKIENLVRAARNIKGVTLTPAALLNPYLVINHQRLLFLPNSFAVLENTFLGKKTEAETSVAEKPSNANRSVKSAKKEAKKE